MSNNQNRRAATQWWINLMGSTKTKLLIQHNLTSAMMNIDNVVRVWNAEKDNYQPPQLEPYDARKDLVERTAEYRKSHPYQK